MFNLKVICVISLVVMTIAQPPVDIPKDLIGEEKDNAVNMLRDLLKADATIITIEKAQKQPFGGGYWFFFEGTFNKTNNAPYHCKSEVMSLVDLLPSDPENPNPPTNILRSFRCTRINT